MVKKFQFKEMIIFQQDIIKFVRCKKSKTPTLRPIQSSLTYDVFVSTRSNTILLFTSVFFNLFGSRHPLRLKKFWRHPYVVKTIT